MLTLMTTVRPPKMIAQGIGYAETVTGGIVNSVLEMARFRPTECIENRIIVEHSEYNVP